MACELEKPVVPKLVSDVVIQRSIASSTSLPAPVVHRTKVGFKFPASIA
jgi:hypothetical protein